ARWLVALALPVAALALVWVARPQLDADIDLLAVASVLGAACVAGLGPGVVASVIAVVLEGSVHGTWQLGRMEMMTPLAHLVLLFAVSVGTAVIAHFWRLRRDEARLRGQMAASLEAEVEALGQAVTVDRKSVV